MKKSSLFLTGCFLVSLGMFLGILNALFGCPGILRGPWLPDQLINLKRAEQWAYLFGVFLVPLTSFVLTRWIVKKEPLNLVAKDPVDPPRPMPGKVFWLFFFGIALYFSVPQISLNAPIDPVDHGLRLATATALDHGQTLFKDIFLNYGPLYEAVQTKIGLTLFGQNIRSLKKIDALVEPLGYLFIFFIAFVLLRHRWLLLFLFLMLVVKDFFWISPRSAFPLLSVLLLILSWKDYGPKPQIVLRAASGAGMALAFLYSSETGILGGVAFSVFYTFLVGGALVRKESLQPLLRETAQVAMGAGVVIGPWLVWIGLTGRLGHYFENLYLPTLTHLTVGAKPTPILCGPLMGFFKNPFSLFTSQGATMRLWVPPLLYMAVLTRLIWNLFAGPWNQTRKAQLLITSFGIFFFLICLGRWDSDHWFKGTAIFWVLTFLVIDDGVGGLKNLVQKRSVTAVAPLLLIFFLGRYAMLYVFPSRLIPTWASNASLFQEIILGKPNARENQEFELSNKGEENATNDVVKEIQRLVPESGSMFIFSNHASFYFSANRRNATPYSLESYILLPSIVQKTMASLAAQKPSLILADEDGTGFRYRPVQQDLANYISENYVVSARSHGFVFMIPRAAPARSS